MNKIQQLLNTLCPDGVEYKTLMEVAKCTKGAQLNKNGLLEDGYPVINGGINPSGYWSEYNFEKNTITISQGGASAGYVNYQLESFWAGAHCYVIVNAIPSMNYKFLYYVIKMNEKKLTECQYGAGIPALASRTVNNLPIPVPPLPVQEEIVRILDKFTELEAELDCRKRQYEYYRNKLLNKSKSENEYKRVKLGEIGRICMCKRVLKEQTTKIGDIPFYKIGTFGKEADAFISKELYEEYKLKYSFPKKGDILISASGTIGRSVVYDGKPAYYQDSNIVWIENDESKALNKWLFYCYQMSPWKVSTGGTISRLYNDNIANAEIPLPPLAVQERIVNVLDNFEQLCNDLGVGLPAEIEARKLQYEYYRNKLLSFTPPLHEIIDNQYITLGISINDYIKIMQYVFGYVYVPMSAIAEICPGKDYRHLSNGEVPVYGSGGIMTYVNDYTYDKPTVLLPRKGSISNIFYVDVPFWNVDTIYYTKIDNSKVITKFLYYLVVNEHIEKYNTSNAARPALTREVLNKIVFPLPPLPEQERIVAILDKFDALVNDLTQGLPAEIEARRKQYEYYRNKLLTFKRKEA